MAAKPEMKTERGGDGSRETVAGKRHHHRRRRRRRHNLRRRRPSPVIAGRNLAGPVAGVSSRERESWRDFVSVCVCYCCCICREGKKWQTSGLCLIVCVSV
ncbi:hypothetical protein Hanom_Chr17g01589001 [Helianthus anomalus]